VPAIPLLFVSKRAGGTLPLSACCWHRKELGRVHPSLFRCHVASATEKEKKKAGAPFAPATLLLPVASKKGGESTTLPVVCYITSERKKRAHLCAHCPAPPSRVEKGWGRVLPFPLSASSRQPQKKKFAGTPMRPLSSSCLCRGGAERVPLPVRVLLASKTGRKELNPACWHRKEGPCPLLFGLFGSKEGGETQET